ncbi:MAG: hypothetical protein ACQESF_04265 [Nanobdellota archaeon]
MKLKKSQVTLFIILGIIILLVIGLFFAFSDIDAISIKRPPSDIQPVVTYTETCIENVAEQGALTLKMQGGYIQIPDKLKRFNAYIESGFDVPYWYYDRMDYIPSISGMQRDLGNFVDDNLDKCVNSYEAFDNEYEIDILNDSESKVIIKDDKINIKTDFAINVKEIGSEKVYHWNDFRVEIDDKLGKLYSLAKDLMDHENDEAFLEEYTDEMIAASDYLPFEGMFINCKPEVYLERELKEYTQELIMHNLNYFQFENTDYKESGIPYYDKLYKIDFTDNDYSNMKVKALYDPSWGMDFKALPSENGVVKSFNFKAYNFLQTCLQLFHHRYNVKYPVMFRITDNEGSDEAFHFITPVILKRNQPNRKGGVEPWESELNQIKTGDYCLESENITLYNLGENNSIATSSQNLERRQNELRVYAVNPLYGWPEGALTDVNISYQCVEARCMMGKTELQKYDGIYMPGSIPRLKTDFPYCMNGLLVAEKKGYHTATKRQTVSDETDGEQVTIDLYKLKPFEYDVRVVQDHNGIISDRPLRENESVLITIKNKEQNFKKTIMYPSQKGYLHNLTLLKGNFNYELEILLVWKNSLVGGAKMDWNPGLSKVLKSNSVMFYVYKKDPTTPPSSIEDLQEIYNKSLEKSVNYPPRFG